jgi:O-antigen ligase/polysaccharide polymerase Wzy-like membrane protein
VRAALSVRHDPGTQLLAGALAALSVAVLTGATVIAITVLAMVLLALQLSRSTVVPYTALIALVILVVLLVPIGRYSIPAGLPFGLDLYRITIGVVLIAWGTSLALEQGTRPRTDLDKPVVAVLTVLILSILVNASRVAPLGPAVLKATLFFASFVGLFFFVSSAFRTEQAIRRVIQILVIGASGIAAVAMIEQRTHFNPFDHLAAIIPFLEFSGPVETSRDGLIRAVASADHPIALGVLFAMVMPLSVSLAFSTSRRWWASTLLLSVGLMATASRTPLLVAIAAAVVLAALRPREMRSLIPLLVPLLVVIKLALPGSIATVKNAFFPPGGLIEQQTALSAEADPLLAGGRVRQLGPELREASRTPLVGQGFGTRQTGFDNPLRNAPILDNQWLGLLLEMGLAGVVAWVWLIGRAVRRLGTQARVRAGPEGWLAAGLAASIVGFAAGMFTYDSLAFVQEAFVFWMLVGLAGSMLRLHATRTPGEDIPA